MWAGRCVRDKVRLLGRAVKASARLGFDVEGNWAPPWLYAFISLAGPAAGVLMLVFMYLVVMGTGSDRTYLAYLMTGAGVFVFVRLVLAGAGWAVIEDREHYKLLRYVYIAPVPFPAQVLGRVAFRLVVAAVGAALTLAAAGWWLGVPFRPDGVRWVGAVWGLMAGTAGVMAMGMVLASVMLLVDRMGWVWAEGVAGLVFLMSGLAFPLELLPAAAQGVGKALPTTYWAELWRQSFFGPEAALSLPGVMPGELAARLGIAAAGWIVAAGAGYIVADRLARRLGRIETETFY